MRLGDGEQRPRLSQHMQTSDHNQTSASDSASHDLVLVSFKTPLRKSTSSSGSPTVRGLSLPVHCLAASVAKSRKPIAIDAAISQPARQVGLGGQVGDKVGQPCRAAFRLREAVHAGGALQQVAYQWSILLRR